VAAIGVLTDQLAAPPDWVAGLHARVPLHVGIGKSQCSVSNRLNPVAVIAQLHRAIQAIFARASSEVAYRQHFSQQSRDRRRSFRLSRERAGPLTRRVFRDSPTRQNLR
jgi:hypothetical protein